MIPARTSLAAVLAILAAAPPGAAADEATAAAPAARRPAEAAEPGRRGTAAPAGRKKLLRPYLLGTRPSGEDRAGTARYLPAPRAGGLPAPRTGAPPPEVYTFQDSTAGLYVFPEEVSPDFQVFDLEPLAPPPPAINLIEDFEEYPQGGRPIDAGFHIEGLGDDVRIESDASLGWENRYLSVRDSPRLARSERPDFWYAPNHRLGVTSFSFDLRVGPGAILRHEWRDRRRPPWRVGPSFEIRDGALVVQGREIVDVPPGKWVSIEIVARLGPGPEAGWDLRIDLPDGTFRGLRGLRHEDRGWSALGWLGFRSLSRRSTTWDLDNVAFTSSLEAHAIYR